MYIKDEVLDLIFNTPEYFAAVFLLLNNKGKTETSPFALEMQLKRKYKVAKQSIVIVEYLRSLGYKDSEIFES
ncbi:hypothetical protein [Chryseobacterium sp. 2R14A]|uniref:hypothetical protein n=1 Tax=Chryseobacterium sp. 2R14A TaxID=3380353 RepID=UPI003CEA621D